MLARLLPRVLALLRRVKPIVSLRRYALVTRHADAREVLADHEAFTVARYAPVMEAITGPFILGLDDTPLYRHDDAALRAAVRPEDLDRIAGAMLGAARRRLGEAGGEVELVELVDACTDEVMSAYFGAPGPDHATQVRWAKSVFHDIFLNVPPKDAVHQRALAAAAEWRPHLDGLIARRRAELAGGADGPDDVVGRLLRDGDLHDISIRHNLIGLIAGWIPTVAKSFPPAIDELLGRPDALAAARDAARAGDRDRVGAYVFEAMRFRPQASGLLRVCARDRVVAEGTRRATTIRAGATVLVATQAAMFDPDAVDAPGAFRPGRPWDDYLHFGHGLHTCWGLAINRVQLPALATALLERPRLARAGPLKVDGPYPASLRLAV